jgi:methyltransferase-like protein
VERIAKARELLGLLIAGLDRDPRPEAEVLRREATYLLGARESYLFHEYLEDTNSPELFSDFVARAKGAGLRYLADARLHTLFPSALGHSAQAVLERFKTQSQTEQYMDFLTLRPFRRSLLVRTETRSDPEIDLGRLARFGLYSSLKSEQPLHLDRPLVEGLKSPDGVAFNVEHPLTKALVSRLASIYPNALPFSIALAQAREEARSGGADHYAEETSVAMEEIFNLYCSGGIGLTLRETVWPMRIRERPCATPLARAQAAAGEGHAATARHRVLGLDWLSAHLLTLLDGSRDRTALVAGLKRAIRDEPELAGSLAKGGGLDSGDDRALERAIGANLRRLLSVFARNGLLV